MWPHLVEIQKKELAPKINPFFDMEQWLVDAIGPSLELWHVIYNYKNAGFYFKRSEHAMLFALRWT